MKLKLFLLLLFATASGFAQSLFHSPYTQHWPTIFTTEYQEIDRSISIGNEEIIIVSESATGKEIQTYLIENIEINTNNIAYLCKSRDGNSVARLVLPLKKEITRIDLYQYSPQLGEEIQTRFLIDYYYE